MINKKVEMFGEDFGLKSFVLVEISFRSGYLTIDGKNRKGVRYRVYENMNTNGFALEDDCITISTTKEILTITKV